jgi:hypothetical protein
VLDPFAGALDVAPSSCSAELCSDDIRLGEMFKEMRGDHEIDSSIAEWEPCCVSNANDLTCMPPGESPDAVASGIGQIFLDEHMGSKVRGVSRTNVDDDSRCLHRQGKLVSEEPYERRSPVRKSTDEL